MKKVMGERIMTDRMTMTAGCSGDGGREYPGSAAGGAAPGILCGVSDAENRKKTANREKAVNQIRTLIPQGNDELPAAAKDGVLSQEPDLPIRVNRRTIVLWRYGKIRDRIRSGLRSFRRDHRGVGTVETILILVVLIALVLIFRTQLTTLVGKIFKAIGKSTDKVIR